MKKIACVIGFLCVVNCAPKVVYSEKPVKHNEPIVSVGEEIAADSITKNQANGSKAWYGKRNSEEIKKEVVLHENLLAVQKVYAAQLEKNSSLEGKMVLKLKIAAQGNVSSIVKYKSDFKDSIFEYNVIDAVIKMKFSKLSYDIDTTEKIYPFIFSLPPKGL